MPRTSSSWSVNDDISATRLNAFNTDLTDLYTYGSDRGRIQRAVSGTALKIDIAAFAWRVGTTSGQYAGGTDITVTNTATNYVEIDSTNTININTTGWTATSARLGTVTCAGGVVTAISIWKPDIVGGNLGGQALVNVETLSANRTLLSTDKFFQYLDANGTDRNVTLDTSGMVEGNQFLVYNSSSLSVLTLKQSSTVILTLDPDESAWMDYDGTTWRAALNNKTQSAQFGDGSDGDVVLSTNTTLTRDMYYRTLDLSTYTLETAGYRVFALAIKGSGKIARTAGNGGVGGAGGIGGSSASGGTAGSSLAAGSLPSGVAGVAGGAGGAGRAGGSVGNGGNGGNGTAGNNQTNSLGSNGVQGGAGAAGVTTSGGSGGTAGTGGTGGTATAIAVTSGSIRNTVNATLWRAFPDGSSPIAFNTSAGSSGGGGGGGGSLGGSGDSGGGGGGGGSGGNNAGILVCAKTLSGSFTIEAKGGIGGAGGTGSGGNSFANVGAGGGGGGGGGGSGGIVILITHNVIHWTGSLVVTGGAGGAGGIGGTNGFSGVKASDGTAGATGNNGIAITLTI